MKTERSFAWAAVLLLTIFLTLTILSSLSMQVLLSKSLHSRAAMDASITDGQITRIHEKIDFLAEEYSFDANAVKALIRREELIRMNQEIAVWWTQIMATGWIEDAPKCTITGLQETIQASLGENTGVTAEEIAEVIGDTVRKTVLPVRETLLTTGIGYISNRVNWPETVHLAYGVPVLCLLLSMLMAGLIALLLARQIRISLMFYGTAAAGTALSVLAACICSYLMDFHGMIAQVTDGLAHEYSVMMGRIMLEAGVLVIGLLIGGIYCLHRYRRAGIVEPGV
jgi:hypothetical protein